MMGVVPLCMWQVRLVEGYKLHADEGGGALVAWAGMR
jgi:hypothetical protein